jgi:hypothetical protein
VAAGRLGRQWIACDASPRAIHTATKRLVGARAPFEVWSALGRPKAGERAQVCVEMAHNGRACHVTLNEYQASIPAELRERILRWSDLVDYWEIDPDYCDGVFRSRWQSFRSRAQPDLITQAALEVNGSRERTVAVRLVDVLGRESLTLANVDADKR